MAPLRLVCTAPLSWGAGYDYLLLAVRRLLDAGVQVHLRIAGDGPAEQHVRYDIADMALGDAVTLTSDESASILATADVFALAAVRGDYVPLLRQAMSHRLPVVAFDIAEFAALVDGAVGVLVHKRDSDAFASALATLAADPVRRAAMGDQAHRRVAIGVLPA